MMNPPGTSITKGNGGLQKVRVTSPDATGEMYLHGAHVTSWQPAGGDEVLFLNSQSRWEDGRAIRGGVPICFPWFGGKADDGIAVSMFTESDEDSKRWWPADFRLAYRVTFGAQLKLELIVTNSGT